MGHSSEDPHIWLEDLSNPRVLEWIRAKNERAREYLGELPSKLYGRVLKYYDVPYLLMVRLSKRAIYALINEGLDRKVYRLNFDGSRELIVKSSDLGRNVVIKWIEVSEEGDRLAFSYSSGSDVGHVRIVDPYANEAIDELYGDVGNFVWIDGDSYYYARFYRSERTPDGVDPPAERVFLRESGVEEMVWGAGLPTNYMVGISKSSDSSKMLLTVSHGWSRSWVYGGSFEDPSSWKKLYGDDKHRFYPIDYLGGKYYVLAFDGGGMGRVLELEERGELAREVVGEDGKYPLSSAEIAGDRLLALYVIDGSHALRVYELSGKLLEEFRPAPPGTISSHSLKCIEDKCIFKYESSYIPYRLYLYRAGRVSVIDSYEIMSDLFDVEEFFVESHDGTPVHVFRVYNRKCDNKRAVVFGYGGFGVSITPSYASYLLAFVEDCGSICISNLRGGGEYGERWHSAGKRERKENVFQDFIAVVRHMRNRGYRVVVMGSSNGGLLTAVTMTRVPELLSGVLIGYPLLDMLRFHKLYVGKLWIDEYGNPDDPGDREYLLRYSPYHNLKPGVKYPPAMIYTGLHDDRVHPGHALKFSAKLDELGVEHVLRVETESGHSGASPQVKARELADILSFIYKVLGV